MKCLFIVFNKLKIKKRKILFFIFGTQTLRHPNDGTQTPAPKRRHPTAGTQTSRTALLSMKVRSELVRLIAHASHTFTSPIHTVTTETGTANTSATASELNLSL